MRREISEVKPVETKSRENYLDSSVRKAFERLQEGKTARAENKLDSSVRKSFEKLESHSTYEKRLQQKMENPEKDLQKLVGEYLKDLKSKSECAETIPDKPFEVSNLEKRTPEENAKMREEFNDNKTQLKREWEKINGLQWPKYKKDIYSASGNLIRKAGSDYDAHHIQPLGMGGNNEARNITPLNAEVHYDKQGIHALCSPYSKLDQALGVTQI